jgi:hypothetical protein
MTAWQGENRLEAPSCFVWDKGKGGPAAVEVVDYH